MITNVGGLNHKIKEEWESELVSLESQLNSSVRLQIENIKTGIRNITFASKTVLP